MTVINKNNKITVKELLQTIPDKLLLKIGKMTDVNYQVKKLFGRNVFYLLLYGLLESNRTSLRSLEDIYNSNKFRIIFNLSDAQDIKYNSLSDRLALMDSTYFELLYNHIYEKFSCLYNQEESLKYKISRVDSTMVGDAANKLKEGMSVGGTTRKKQVKYTICLTDLLPSSFEVFTEQIHLNENNTIPKTIFHASDKSKDNVFVFDHGAQSRDRYCDFSDEKIRFVTKLRVGAKHNIVHERKVDKNKDYGDLKVLRDQDVYLFNQYDKKTKYAFRLIKTKNIRGKELWFLTNQSELSIDEIINIYKKRWDIEVFFRFIKQELNMNHLFSTNKNGLTIILYMTLISSMLILIYKKLNAVGYKTAKRRFCIEMDEMITILIIKMCGGDPSIVFR